MTLRSDGERVVNFQDRTIQCVDCGREFNYSAREQEFFKQMNFTEPKRCPQCRSTRRQGREARDSLVLPSDYLQAPRPARRKSKGK
jgi:DNA-directed RNA polymerase subunit RPC12/RpoP